MFQDENTTRRVRRTAPARDDAQGDQFIVQSNSQIRATELPLGAYLYAIGTRELGQYHSEDHDKRQAHVLKGGSDCRAAFVTWSPDCLRRRRRPYQPAANEPILASNKLLGSGMAE